MKTWTMCTEHTARSRDGSCAECGGDRNLIEVVSLADYHALAAEVAAFALGREEAADADPSSRWGIWCKEDRAWCMGTIGTREAAASLLPRWVSGEAAAVKPGDFHYEVRRIPTDRAL